MSTQAISATVGTVPNASASLNAASEEATESAAATVAEAAQGDRQAVRLLASRPQAAPPRVSPEGVGKKLDENG